MLPFASLHLNYSTCHYFPRTFIIQKLSHRQDKILFQIDWSASISSIACIFFKCTLFRSFKDLQWENICGHIQKYVGW